ncbi:ABC transporter permease [Peribacillus sp. SCS-155]|uniref:ABC transporter permease n=1 Tax=Peribacillus sedimenti TaxID=3115297 RepID=UPI0039061226
MVSLIKNELMKTFTKKASWIYIIIIALAAIVIGVIFHNFSGEPDKNWRKDLESQIAQAEKDLQNEEIPATEKKFIKEQMEINQNYLDENVNPNAVSNWHFMNSVVTGLTVLVTLFTVIVSSASVSAEFADGTIKQLLIRPHQRWSILLSKYISLLIYSLILVVTLIAAGYITGLVLFGAGDYSAKIFELAIDGQKETIVGAQFFLKVLYYLPSLLVIMTISFMLSTLFKSQALAVGIGIFVLFVSSALGSLIVVLAKKFTWAKFLIFPHLDLTVYALQDKILENVTLPMSLGILGVYYIIFIVLTFVFFQKRDISI